jgi:hypothetical protein
MFALAELPAVRNVGSPSTHVDVLWRAGSFVCELRSDPTCPAFLSVLKDGEPVLEVPVLSALDAEERAVKFRILVERHETMSRSAT